MLNNKGVNESSLDNTEIKMTMESQDLMASFQASIKSGIQANMKEIKKHIERMNKNTGKQNRWGISPQCLDQSQNLGC